MAGTGIGEELLSNAIEEQQAQEAEKQANFQSQTQKMQGLVPSPLNVDNYSGPAEKALTNTMPYNVVTNAADNALYAAQLGAVNPLRKQNEQLTADEVTKQLASNMTAKELQDSQAAKLQQQQAPQPQVSIQAQGSIPNPYADMEKAAKTGLAAGIAKAKADESFYQEKARIEQENQKRIDDNEAAFNLKWDAQMADYEKTVGELRSQANNQVIPNKYLASMDTGSSIMVGIAAIAGLYGQQATGSNTNVGFDMINKAIDKDIALQQYQLDRESQLKRAELGVKENLLSKMREKYKDNTSAILASKASMYALAEAKLGEQLNKKGGANQLAASAAAQQQLAAISAQKYQYLAQLKNQEAMNQSFKGSDIRNLTDEQIGVMNNQDKTFRDRYVAGYGPATNKNAAEEFRKYETEVTPAIQALDRIKVLTSNYNKVTDLETRAKINTELNGLVGALRMPLTGPGILTEKEREMLLNDVIGNPSAIVSLSSLQKAKLNTIYGKLVSDLNQKTKTAGFPESKASQASKKITFE